MFGLKVVLWSSGLGPAVPRSRASLVPSPLFLWFLGPVLPRPGGFLILALWFVWRKSVL